MRNTMMILGLGVVFLFSLGVGGDGGGGSTSPALQGMMKGAFSTAPAKAKKDVKETSSDCASSKSRSKGKYGKKVSDDCVENGAMPAEKGTGKIK